MGVLWRGRVQEHGKHTWSCYQVHSQHPVILSKALFHELVLCLLSPCNLWASMKSASRSSQPKDILRVEEPPLLSAQPSTYYLHLPVPHSSTRRTVLLIPSFNAFHDFVNSCEAPLPFNCLFFRLFYSFSHFSYSSSFMLLITLVTLFWNFFSFLHFFEKERPELHPELKGWTNYGPI